MTIRLGYARASTKGQKLEIQHASLTAAGCTEIFDDLGVSGAKNSGSKGFTALFERVRELRVAGEEVEVCVVKLDRFSRSLSALLRGVEDLDQLGASFRALDGFTYDAGSAMSRLQLQMLGALAEFERSLIRSRMDEGREVAVAKGLRLGKKPKLTRAAVEAIRAGYADGEGKSPDTLAKEWKISKALVGRVLGIYPSLPPYFTLDEWEEAKAKAGTKEVAA